ncbi:unnamed protein product, partial [Larinioides sclopetarius]
VFQFIYNKVVSKYYEVSLLGSGKIGSHYYRA